MPRPAKRTMVVDHHKDVVGLMPPPAPRLDFPRPMMIAATVLFWAVVIMALKMLLA